MVGIMGVEHRPCKYREGVEDQHPRVCFIDRDGKQSLGLCEPQHIKMLVAFRPLPPGFVPAWLAMGPKVG